MCKKKTFKKEREKWMTKLFQSSITEIRIYSSFLISVALYLNFFPSKVSSVFSRKFVFLPHEPRSSSKKPIRTLRDKFTNRLDDSHDPPVHSSSRYKSTQRMVQKQNKKNNFLWNESTFERFYFKPQLPEPFSSPNDYKQNSHTLKKRTKSFLKEGKKKVYSDLFLLRVPFFDGKFNRIELWGKWQNIMFAFEWKYSLPIVVLC